MNTESEGENHGRCATPIGDTRGNLGEIDGSGIAGPEKAQEGRSTTLDTELRSRESYRWYLDGHGACTWLLDTYKRGTSHFMSHHDPRLIDSA